MKLCWNNIENIKLTKQGNYRDVVKKVTYYHKLCKKCHIESHKKDGCRYDQLKMEEC